MTSLVFVTVLAILIITPLHVNSVCIEQQEQEDKDASLSSTRMSPVTSTTPPNTNTMSPDANMTSPEFNMTSPDSNMTSPGSNMTLENTTSSTMNETDANCTIIIEERPSTVEVQLAELANKTEENFNVVQEGLTDVLDQVLSNFTESVNKIYSENDRLLERLDELEASINEVKSEKKETEEQLQEQYTSELTCDYVRDNVSASMSPRSGLYWLRDKYGRRYVTYCDFDEKGRSWTLVASVHENKMGVDGRCSAGDKWSSELGKDADPNEDTAWSDLSTFGDVTTATSGDYKNPGYFSTKVRNVMIWHVKENTHVDDFKEKAYLRYRTTNNVLEQYGGNMYTLYNDHFPHKPGYNFPNHGPTAPVVYDKGSWTQHSFHLGNLVESRISGGNIQTAVVFFLCFSLWFTCLPSTRDLVDIISNVRIVQLPGIFVTQLLCFRAVNLAKDSYALCPGGAVVRSSSGYYSAESFCLGSNKRPSDMNKCGDFAYWDKSGYGSGVDWSADQILVKTAFLIFYGSD